MPTTYLLTAIATLLLTTGIAIAGNLSSEPEIIEPPSELNIVHAQAASDSAFVVVHDGGLEFRLFDVRQQSFKLIAKSKVGDWDHRLHHTQWSEGSLVLFRNWEGVIELINPGDMSTKASFSADLQNAPLRISRWIDEYSILVDETDFYQNTGGKLTKAEKPNPFAHSVQTGLIIHENKRVITSGFHDQTIKVWSLPEGNLLHDWDISAWFSKREITAIALSHNRLLVATQTGHLEERSLKTGKKLWSARPCREQLNFYYSSQFSSSLSINVDDGLFFSCGSQIGYIEPQKNGWQISDFNTVLNKAVAESHRLESTTHQVANQLVNVETIPHSDLAILIFTDGSSIVVHKKQKHVVRKLESVKAGLAPVTYIAATGQLFLADKNGYVHLYTLGPTAATDQASKYPSN